jgi:PAS domain S-box-containing protein
MIIGVLEIFSACCIVWALAGWPAPWPKLAWVGVAGALGLTMLTLIPGWPVPTQIHTLVITMAGAPFLAIKESGRIRWPHLLTPLILAVANFLSLLDLTGLAWLTSLLAYVCFISAIHWESIQANHQLYLERQQAAETLVQEAIDLNREQQRWLEASELINATPNLNQSMEHLVRSMAQITHTDQSAVFMLDTHLAGQARLVTLYSPERPVHLAKLTDIVFDLDTCPILREAIDDQQQYFFAHPNGNNLSNIYALWSEDRAGPTLIQPLAIRGRPVGALLLGNPVTRRPIRESDRRLCRTLAPQIAMLVESRRRYLELAGEAEAMADVRRQQSYEVDEYPDILEIMSEGLVMSDTNGRVKLVNQAAERILNKSRAELLNQPIATVYGAIDSAENIEDLSTAFSRRNQPLPTFIEDDERAIQGRLIPWRNRQGEWKGVIALFRDVSRETKADRARNDFIAALSRELRAPLTAIKGYSDLIIQGAWDDYTPEQIRVQQIIYSSAERMVSVLDNAIQLSAQNRRKILPKFEEIDATKIIDEALHEIVPLIRLRELKLARDVKPDLPPLMADPSHIRQILNNLLSNACRFTPPGGKVALRAWVQLERLGHIDRPHLHLAVADNGIGIPRSELKRVFNPFYQIKNHSVDAEIGMGMGLAVTKELVELHQGRVWVESTVGQGSVFQVALPLTQD